MVGNTVGARGGAVEGDMFGTVLGDEVVGYVGKSVSEVVGE